MGILNQRYITYAEAQELYNVGRSKLQRMVVNGVIEAYRPGKETLLDAASGDFVRVKKMGVFHCLADIAMAHDLRHGADVDAIHDQVAGR